ncbi:hypothetical protein MexAM1_META1p0883 [Methylorubrum extorquens AM1]|uniref:Uncharacterized protein n=1 Tax=Methylorubrum extorquens (strain ATCC 14718 / DSM 1338 / JCM 2805 / NCIMB 9133 / AM1) TaxID=272630 RepID=C5AWG9_METEA|nr:hypothetical protein MexAM1_META1p0883 [Methylorubrum extorquens AM1]
MSAAGAEPTFSIRALNSGFPP